MCSKVWTGEDALDAASFTLGHDIAKLHRTDGNHLYILSMTIHPNHRSGIVKRFFEQSIALMRVRLPRLRESALMLSGSATRIFLKQ